MKKIRVNFIATDGRKTYNGVYDHSVRKADLLWRYLDTWFIDNLTYYYPANLDEANPSISIPGTYAVSATLEQLEVVGLKMLKGATLSEFENHIMRVCKLQLFS